MLSVLKHLPQADLWIEDTFLQQGLERIFEAVKIDRKDVKFVFFTIEQYENVKNHPYDMSTHRFVLLTDGHMYHFLDAFFIHRISAHTPVNKLKDFIIEAQWQPAGKISLKPEKMLLTRREKLLLSQLGEGKKVLDIAKMSNLHFKTIYQNRRSLIKKLGCMGQIDFMQILRTPVFQTWLSGH